MSSVPPRGSRDSLRWAPFTYPYFLVPRVYPGWGRHFVTRIGQLIITGSSKTSAMYHQRKKPALLRWTQAWRRQHKKLNVEAQQKKRARKVIKVARAIVGANLEEVCLLSACSPIRYLPWIHDNRG